MPSAPSPPTGYRSSPGHIGRDALIVGGVVLSAFAAYFISVKAYHQKKIDRGDVAQYQWTYANQTSTAPTTPASGRSFSKASEVEHNHQHNVLGTVEHNGRTVPSPQRPSGKNDGHVYTKSPNFADSYDKIKGGRFKG